MHRNSIRLLKSLYAVSTIKQQRQTTIKFQQFRQYAFRAIMSQSNKSVNDDPAVKAQAERVRQLKADKADPETVCFIDDLFSFLFFLRSPQRCKYCWR